MNQSIDENPAFFYGIYTLIGTAFAISPHWIYFVPAFVLLLGKRIPFQRICLALGLMGALFFYAKAFYTFPELGEEKIAGKGVFSVDTVAVQSSPFHRSFLYQGTLQTFKAHDGRVFEKLPCRIYLPLKNSRMTASSKIEVTGVLLQKNPRKYVLKLKSWEEGKPNFAEWRFGAHTQLTRYLQDAFPSKEVRTFLLSMLTGEIEERLLSVQFNRLGLHHILGVSGFQFVILTAFLGFILRTFLSYRAAAFALIALLTLYFVFLGGSPPVLRAWIAIVIFLIGILSNKRCTPLNALGVALIVEIAFDPLTITHIGFQLSFLCTGAILIFFPWMRRMMGKFLAVRSLQEVRKMSLWNQHGYLALSLVRESLALNLAVHCVALPVLLSLFGKFPLMSLVYNLFFPFCSSVAFLLLLIGMVIPGIHALNHGLTQLLLKVATHPPALLDFSIRAPFFPIEITLLILTAFLYWAMRSASERSAG